MPDTASIDVEGVITELAGELLSLQILNEGRRELRAILREVKRLARAVLSWEKRSRATATRVLDCRLQPFALALGRLLATDVLRYPKAGSS